MSNSDIAAKVSLFREKFLSKIARTPDNATFIESADAFCTAMVETANPKDLTHIFGVDAPRGDKNSRGSKTTAYRNLFSNIYQRIESGMYDPNNAENNNIVVEKERELGNINFFTAQFTEAASLYSKSFKAKHSTWRGNPVQSMDQGLFINNTRRPQVPSNFKKRPSVQLGGATATYPGVYVVYGEKSGPDTSEGLAVTIVRFAGLGAPYKYTLTGDNDTDADNALYAMLGGTPGDSAEKTEATPTDEAPAAPPPPPAPAPAPRQDPDRTPFDDTGDKKSGSDDGDKNPIGDIVRYVDLNNKGKGELITEISYDKVPTSQASRIFVNVGYKLNANSKAFGDSKGSDAGSISVGRIQKNVPTDKGKENLRGMEVVFIKYVKGKNAGKFIMKQRVDESTADARWDWQKGAKQTTNKYITLQGLTPDTYDADVAAYNLMLEKLQYKGSPDAASKAAVVGDGAGKAPAAAADAANTAASQQKATAGKRTERVQFDRLEYNVEALDELKTANRKEYDELMNTMKKMVTKSQPVAFGKGVSNDEATARNMAITNARNSFGPGEVKTNYTSVKLFRGANNTYVAFAIVAQPATTRVQFGK